MKISTSSIKNSKVYKTSVRWTNTNFVAKLVCLIVIWFVVSIPLDLYLLTRLAVGPDGFWQELAMILVAVIAIGWLQGILLFFGIVLSIALIAEDF